MSSNFVFKQGVQVMKMSEKKENVLKTKPCFRSKGSKSFSIGDHYSIMGYGSLPANELTHIPISN